MDRAHESRELLSLASPPPACNRSVSAIIRRNAARGLGGPVEPVFICLVRGGSGAGDPSQAAGEKLRAKGSTGMSGSLPCALLFVRGPRLGDTVRMSRPYEGSSRRQCRVIACDGSAYEFSSVVREKNAVKTRCSDKETKRGRGRAPGTSGTCSLS